MTPDGPARHSGIVSASRDDLNVAARMVVEAAAAAAFAIGKRNRFVEIDGFATVDEFRRCISTREFVHENGPVSATIADFCIGYRSHADAEEAAILDRARSLIEAVCLSDPSVPGRIAANPD